MTEPPVTIPEEERKLAPKVVTELPSANEEMDAPDTGTPTDIETVKPTTKADTVIEVNTSSVSTDKVDNGLESCETKVDIAIDNRKNLSPITTTHASVVDDPTPSIIDVKERDSLLALTSKEGMRSVPTQDKEIGFRTKRKNLADLEIAYHLQQN